MSLTHPYKLPSPRRMTLGVASYTWASCDKLKYFKSFQINNIFLEIIILQQNYNNCVAIDDYYHIDQFGWLEGRLMCKNIKHLSSIEHQYHSNIGVTRCKRNIQCIILIHDRQEICVYSWPTLRPKNLLYITPSSQLKYGNSNLHHKNSQVRK